MRTWLLACISLYYCLLLCYLAVETGGRFRLRAANKLALAALYLALAAILLARTDGAPARLLVLGGLCLCCAGDAWLLWSFSKGGVCFGLGGLALIAFEVRTWLTLGVSPVWLAPAAAVFAALYGGFWLACRRGAVRIPDKARGVRAYLLVATTHGALGTALALARPEPAIRLLGSGLCLFMLSDYFLVLFKFKFRSAKWLLRANSFTYFTGVLLAALSLGA